MDKVLGVFGYLQDTRKRAQLVGYLNSLEDRGVLGKFTPPNLFCVGTYAHNAQSYIEQHCEGDSELLRMVKEWLDKGIEARATRSGDYVNVNIGRAQVLDEKALEIELPNIRRRFAGCNVSCLGELVFEIYEAAAPVPADSARK